MDETKPLGAVKSIALERYKMYVNGHISSDVAFENCKFDTFIPLEVDGLVMRLSASIWGESLKKIEKSYPLNWVESLKERFLPAWAKKYWPVKWDIIDIEVAALYPKYVLPKQTHGPMKVAVMDRSYRTY